MSTFWFIVAVIALGAWLYRRSRKPGPLGLRRNYDPKWDTDRWRNDSFIRARRSAIETLDIAFADVVADFGDTITVNVSTCFELEKETDQLARKYGFHFASREVHRTVSDNIASIRFERDGFVVNPGDEQKYYERSFDLNPVLHGSATSASEIIAPATPVLHPNEPIRIRLTGH